MKAFADAIGNPLNQLVARHMSKAIVHMFEVVEIEVEHRQLPTLCRCSLYFRLEALAQSDRLAAELLAGMVVTVGDRVIDTSFRHQLREVEDRLSRVE